MKRASVTKRPYTYKDKTEERWLVLWTDLKHKRREKWFRNKRHADAYATKIDRELADNIHVADRATITWGKACEAWLADCERRHQRLNRSMMGATVMSYQNLVRIVIRCAPWLAHAKLNKITSRKVQAIVNDCATKYEASTCRQVHGVFWNVFEFAIKEELGIVRNPIKDRRIELPKLKKKSADDIPSFEDVRALLLYLHTPRQGRQHKLLWAQRLVMVVLAAFGGLRAGECGALDWNCVDLVKRTIKVKHSLSRYDGIKGPKSESGERDVPMNPIVHNVMTRYGDFVGRKGPVFRTGWGGRRHYDTFGRQLRITLKGAGIKHHTFHELRHFAGSAWLAQGMRIQDVSWLLGHSDIKTTMGTYAHQLKGDDHARQVLNEQVTRFPNIPHSLIETPAVTPAPYEPPALLPAPKPELTEDVQPIHQPIQVASAIPLEVVPTVDIPSEAPQWVGYAVRLLQSGWQVRDVAREVGYDQTRVWKVFKICGLDAPEKIRLAALWARAQYMKDSGFPGAAIARVCGVTTDAISRKIGRHRPGSKRGDRSDEKRPPRLVRCQTCAKEFEWSKSGTNPKACPECHAGNADQDKLLKIRDNLASAETGKRENCGEKQLNLWKT